MDERYIRLNFSDDELAKAIADSPPPSGVTVSKLSPIIQTSAPAEIFWQVAIQFGVPVSAQIVGNWIWEAIKQRDTKPARGKAVRKRAAKRARINRQELALQKRAIVRLIQKEIENYDARKAQEREDE